MTSHRPLYLRAFDARCRKALRFDKPVVSWVDGCWALTTVDPMVPEMYIAYLNRLNGIDTKRQLDGCYTEIKRVGRALTGLGNAKEARMVLDQYRVRKFTDLPREWYPAVLYDLSQLLKEFIPCLQSK